MLTTRFIFFAMTLGAFAVLLGLGTVAAVRIGRRTNSSGGDSVFQWRAHPTEASWISAHSAYGSTANVQARPSLVNAAKTSYYAECDGSGSSFIEGSSAIHGGGSDGATVAAWFQPSQFVAAAPQVIFSNIGETGGLAVHLESSTACGVVKVRDGTEIKVCGGQVSLGHWHFLVLRVHISSAGSSMSLYLDGVRTERTTFSADYVPIGSSDIKPLICAGPAATGKRWAFAGLVHSVHVSNYPWSERFLLARPAFDGMTYLGLPSYHDGNWGQPMEERVDWPSSPAVHPLSFVPFMNDDYIVQGVASSCEASRQEDCTQEKLYLSLYFKDTAGNIASSTHNPDNTALVAELDASSGRLTRCWKVSSAAGDKEKYSHAGGIAFFDDYLYISGSLHLYKYDISPIRSSGAAAAPTSGGGPASCATLTSTNSWPTKASSFTSTAQINGSRYILAGRFCLSNTISQTRCKYEDESKANPYAYAYLLDEATGDIITSSNPPYKKYRLPEKAQGVDVDPTHQKLIVSTSYGDNDAQLRKYPLVECPYGESCGVPSQEGSSLSFPAGGEDTAMTPSGRLWSASESGGRYFQKRTSPWGGFFPFVYYTTPTASGWA